MVSPSGHPIVGGNVAQSGVLSPTWVRISVSNVPSLGPQPPVLATMFMMRKELSRLRRVLFPFITWECKTRHSHSRNQHRRLSPILPKVEVRTRLVIPLFLPKTEVQHASLSLSFSQDGYTQGGMSGVYPGCVGIPRVVRRLHTQGGGYTPGGREATYPGW